MNKIALILCFALCGCISIESEPSRTQKELPLLELDLRQDKETKVEEEEHGS